MSIKATSITHLLNQIRDNEIVLPDLQRDFVWNQDQIRRLFDSVMRGYPFGSLLLWETRFLEVAYREFALDFQQGMTFTPKVKVAGKAAKMVLDGQQRLQAFHLGIHGSYDGRRLYFNITSGRDYEDEETGDTSGSYRFEFWQESEQANRPRRLVRVAEIAGWPPRQEDSHIRAAIESIPLEGAEAERAARNLRLLRQVISQSDLVAVETIDEEVSNKAQARTIDEILEIFERVNSGGTRLNRSDLMFSLIKTKWMGARQAFDELIQQVDLDGAMGIDKDFLIRGLLVVADAPVAFNVDTIERHWAVMEPKFDTFASALKSAIDFCRDPDVGIASASLLQPVATLYPLLYYLSRQKNSSVPDAQRRPLRTVLYFLLFNEFLRGKSPEARIRWLREVLVKAADDVPVDGLLAVINEKQRGCCIQTTAEMLTWMPTLALNIVQPGVRKKSLSWQVKAEVDHIFPQSTYRERFPTIVDDIGNFAYLGKLRNIRKSAQPPWEYFKDISDDELDRDFLIDRSYLADDKFEDFVRHRRERIITVVKDFLER